MINEQEKGKNSRRRFLAISLLTGAGLIVNKVEAQADPLIDTPAGKKTKMLTPDGQLVEVDENVLALVQQGNKESNQEILDWSTAQHKTKE